MVEVKPGALVDTPPVALIDSWKDAFAELDKDKDGFVRMGKGAGAASHDRWKEWSLSLVYSAGWFAVREQFAFSIRRLSFTSLHW